MYLLVPIRHLLLKDTEFPLRESFVANATSFIGKYRTQSFLQSSSGSGDKIGVWYQLLFNLLIMYFPKFQPSQSVLLQYVSALKLPKI